MHGRQQSLLFFQTQEVDFVDVKHPFVGAVDGAGLNTVVSRRLHTARLERVVADITEQGARQGCRSVDERGKFVQVVLHEHFRNAAVVDGTESASDEHVPESEQEATEQQGEQVAGLKSGDEEQESDGGKSDEQHALGFLTLLPNRFFLNLDDAFCTAGGHGSNPRDVFIVFVRVNQNVLKGVFGKQVGHGLRKHGLARSGVADHQHVAALFRGFLDDDRTGFLTDDLVDQTVGDGDVGRGFKLNRGDPFLNRGGKNLVSARRFRGPNGHRLVVTGRQ